MEEFKSLMAWGMKLSLSLVVGPGAAVPSARWQQAKQFMVWVIGVFDDLVGLLPAALGGEVLRGCADFTTLFKALRFRAVQLPYQVVTQSVTHIQFLWDSIDLLLSRCSCLLTLQPCLLNITTNLQQQT